MNSVDKTMKITLNVRYEDECHEYTVSKPGSPGDYCDLCGDEYEDIIGSEVVGDVTFILRKIKGNAKDYVHPFSIRGANLMAHDGKQWEYMKTMALLSYALDTKALRKWAGKSMFAIEMEW